MSPVNPDERPIFVIGNPRSGTTLMRQMLNAHPRIYLTFQAYFYTAGGIGLQHMNVRRWLEGYFSSYSFAWLQLDPQAVLRELPEPLPHNALPCVFQAVMRAKARQHGKFRYGDKSPKNTFFLSKIFRDYTHPRIVRMVRDPRAVVTSMRRMPWAPASYGLNALYRAREESDCSAFVSRIHEVRLEDLLTRPEREMRAVLEFVGEPWDSAVLEHVKHAPTDGVPPFPWMLKATQVRQSTQESWRSTLSPAWIRLIESSNRAGMLRHGYPQAELATEPSVREKAAAVLYDLPAAFGFARRYLPILARHCFGRPPTAMYTQTRSLALNPDAWRYYPDFVEPQP